MTTADGFSRREIVVMGAKLVAGGIVLRITGCKNDSRSNELVLPTSFTEIGSMRVVGKKYLDAHPDEVLSKLVDEVQPGRGFPALEAEIRKQYEAGQVVRVEGWVLALTEARVYAIVALGK